MRLAHRVAWINHYGDIPDGLCVCHKCDTPACVNPSHLFLGTQGENINDSASKGRLFVPRGETNGSAKLTEKDVLSIRADNRIQKEIAADHGVSPSIVGHIKTRRRWGHI
jgi:hypothetical protein